MALRDDLRSKIEEMGGAADDEHTVLVIQKTLFKTDVETNQARLSVPFTQLHAHHFLTMEEAAFLDNGGAGRNPMKVELLDTNLERHGNIVLARWNMRNPRGEGSAVYVLTHTWNKLVRSNGLKAGDTLQVWSFRVEGELNLAIIRLPRIIQDQEDNDADDM